jgi:hypothetical protein
LWVFVFNALFSQNQSNQQTKAMRLTLQQGAQAAFLSTHGKLPVLFTPQMVMELNKMRPLGDQLEVLPGGMLKHHCGHPECPGYLTNFATQDDLAKNQRHGLFRHLKLLFFPSMQFVPGFHITAERVFRRAPRPLEQVCLFGVFCGFFSNTDWHRHRRTLRRKCTLCCGVK